jgi:hypothetical protein
MKIVVACFAFILTASLCFAQNSVWRVLKSNDTTAAEVLDNGNMTVNGSVTANSVATSGTLSSGALSATTVSAASVTVSGATGLVSSAAALAAPTNEVPSAGFRIRIQGTNYIIALYPN